MKLRHWLKERRIKAEQFGRTLDTTGQAVRRYASGERMPDAIMVEKIVAATKGEVSVTDLHEARLEYMNANPREGEAA